jgi:hypothetical protein
MLGQHRGTHRHCLRKVDGDRELLAVIRKIVEFRGVPQLSDEHRHENFGGSMGSRQLALSRLAEYPA